MQILIYLTVIAALISNIGFAHAADEKFITGSARPELVERFIGVVNTNFTKARLADGSNPSPVTQTEIRDGVIPLDAAQVMVSRAFDTATAQWCGLDWAALSFAPIMKKERGRKIWTDRQIAYIGMLHGVVQGAVQRQLHASAACSDIQKAEISKFLKSKQW